jgi:uncharacterized protein with NAD-binding domain and iron-sulfur cluster
MTSSVSETTTQPRKIAILGGGCGGLTAALEMTREPNWQEKYEVTVYQMGWRLGGKGAAGRNPDRANRIEEHGFHIWLGFYNNAFRMMQEVYKELDRAPGTPLATWDEAFTPRDFILLQRKQAGEWKHWPLMFPPNSQIPGATEPQSLWDMVVRGVEYCLLLLREASDEGWFSTEVLDSSIGLTGWLDARFPQLQSVESWLRWMQTQGERFLQSPTNARLAAGVLRRVSKQIKQQLRPCVGVHDHGTILFEMLDIMFASLSGILLDGVLLEGPDAIDGQDFTAWLLTHGLSQESVDSVCLRVCYELTFAYVGGDPAKPAFEAGSGLYNLLLLLFGYRGHIMWEMQGGMGDCIFAPVYQVLKHRGVRFRFFHRVEQLHLDNSRRFVERIAVEEQAQLTKEEYEPLTQVKGLDVWPHQPFWTQLEEGEALCRQGVDFESWWSTAPTTQKKMLQRGRDFDHVVLATSLAPLAFLAQELIEAHLPFQKMVEEVKTVETQAAQLWLAPEAEVLTGERPSQPPVGGGFEPPFGTNADMSDLLRWESWEEVDEVSPPRSLFYLCGPLRCRENAPLQDSDYPAQQRELVRKTLVSYLEHDVRHLWPGTEAGVWPMLVAEEGVEGEARLGTWQYFRANVQPDQRYVQTLPGTNRYRLAPSESGFSNVTLAGDWTRTPINAGCVEAAVSSGLLAGAHVCGRTAALVENNVAQGLPLPGMKK